MSFYQNDEYLMVVFKIMVTLPLVFTFMTQITVVDDIIMSYMSFIRFIYLTNSIFSVWTLSFYKSLSYENVPLIRQLNKFYFSVFPLLSFSSLNTSTAPKFPSIQQLCISSIFSMFVILKPLCDSNPVFAISQHSPCGNFLS